MDRLSGALRELAAALEEVSEEAEWEVVEPKSSATPEPDGARRGPRARASALRAPPGFAPTSSSAPPSSSCTGKSAPTRSFSRLGASSSREPADTSRAASSGERVRPSTWGVTPRHYLVLFSPKDRTLEGHWFGPWAKLEPLLPGAKFCGSAVQLRKMTSKAMAEREWAAVHGSRPHAKPRADLSAEEAATSVLAAVSSAAQGLGQTPVSGQLSAAQVLADPPSRQAAARWRSGDTARRVTAALAKVSAAAARVGGSAQSTDRSAGSSAAAAGTARQPP